MLTEYRVVGNADEGGFYMGFNLGEETQDQAGVIAGQDNDGLVFDLNTVEEVSSDFEVLPKGTYNAVVEEFEFTYSQSSGAPMCKAVYTITDAEYENRKIFDFYVLSGNGAKYSLPRLKQLVTRVCPDVESSNFNPVAFAESGVVINRPLSLVLGIQTQKSGDYKGEKRNNVREILAASEMGGGFLG